MDRELIGTMDEATLAVRRLVARTDRWRRDDIRPLWRWARLRAAEQLRLWHELCNVDNEIMATDRHLYPRGERTAVGNRVAGRMAVFILNAKGEASDLEMAGYNFETVGMPFLFIRALQAMHSPDRRRRQRVRRHLLPLFIEASVARELVIAVLDDLVDDGQGLLLSMRAESGVRTDAFLRQHDHFIAVAEERVGALRDQWRLALRMLKAAGSRMARLFPELSDYLD